MVRKIVLKVKKLNKAAQLPKYAHPGDCGLDVVPIDVTYDIATDCYIYRTGLATETEIFTASYCFPKSRNYKTNYYMTNHVGIVDTKTYRGEICVIFKNRDSIDLRCLAHAVEKYDALPWYKKLMPGTILKLKSEAFKQIIENPLLFAPYKIGESVFQIVLQELVPVEVVEVKKLTDTKRGTGGFGSTKKKGN